MGGLALPAFDPAFFFFVSSLIPSCVSLSTKSAFPVKRFQRIKTKPRRTRLKRRVCANILARPRGRKPEGWFSHAIFTKSMMFCKAGIYSTACTALLFTPSLQHIHHSHPSTGAKPDQGKTTNLRFMLFSLLTFFFPCGGIHGLIRGGLGNRGTETRGFNTGGNNGLVPVALEIDRTECKRAPPHWLGWIGSDFHVGVSAGMLVLDHDRLRGF